MIGENGVPETPEWHVVDAFRTCCGNCTTPANYCAGRQILGEPCCGKCDHHVEAEPLLWLGDQV